LGWRELAINRPRSRRSTTTLPGKGGNFAEAIFATILGGAGALRGVVGVNTMMNFIHGFMRDESGAAAAEYALILAIVGAGIAGAAYYLGQQVSSGIHGAGAKICGGSGSTC